MDLSSFTQLLSLIPVNQMTFLQCQLLCIVCAELYYRLVRPLGDTRMKHLFIFFIGNALLIIFLNGFNWKIWKHVYGPVIATYSWCFLNLNPWPLTAALFGHLSWTHWRKMQERYLYYNLDHSIILMLMTIKMTSFAFDWHRESKIDARKKTFPAIVEFLGYAFMFPGLVSGPAILYPPYSSFIQKTHADPHHNRRHRWGMNQFVKAVLFGIAHVLLQSKFQHSYLLSQEFISLPLWYRLFYIHIANMSSRFMYYTAWLMAETSHVIMGFQIGDIQIIRPMQIELATDPREVLLNWNISTDRWLHRYFYLKGSFGVLGANIFVKIVSAMWHGFYPGYYMMFISYGLVMATSRALYKRLTWPLPSRLKPVILFVPVWLVLDFITPPFVLLTGMASVKFYSSMYWWVHILCFASLLLFKYTRYCPMEKI